MIERTLFAAALWMLGIGLLQSLPARAASAACTPTEVVVFSNRVHVRCFADRDGIRFFAVPTANEELAHRVETFGIAAIGFAKALHIEFDPRDETSGPAFGCRPHDCRPIEAIGITTARPDLPFEGGE